MAVNARVKIVLYAVAAVLIIGLLAAGLWYLTRPRYNLTSAYVTQAPVLDGNGSDAAWSKATVLDLPVKDGPTVSVKSVYTADMVYYQARYKDSTKNAIDEPWTFDGKAWKRGPTSDQFALFFDMNHSVTDFETKGFGVMNFGFKPHNKVWEFGINGPKPAKTGSTMWEGYNQEADVWMMHSSISSPFGMGDDGIFAVNRQYLTNPTMVQPVVWMQWDQFDSPGMLKLNTNIWQEALNASQNLNASPVTVEKPYLMYGDSTKNLSNTPYPFADQLVPITDYGQFKAGDKLPWVYFDRSLSGSWGGSRADIKGKMAYKDGYWTVEMGRALDTTHNDDIRFPPADKLPTPFGVLVRTDGSTIRYSVPAELTFGPKGGN
jgi:hypothetical protein